jgi:demethylmenaquinone methyltransferase/2-methoxy-6-polyprenyl-1,4-benzoquinol methylase
MDPLSGFVDRVTEKVRDAGLRNVEVVRRDALNTGLEAASIDLVLLFGVVPYPTLPLDRLLPEMHRVLKAEGVLAVWLFPISFGVPTAILRSGLFTGLGKKNGVYTYRRSGGSAGFMQ